MFANTPSKTIRDQGELFPAESKWKNNFEDGEENERSWHGNFSPDESKDLKVLKKEKCLLIRDNFAFAMGAHGRIRAVQNRGRLELMCFSENRSGSSPAVCFFTALGMALQETIC